jgi:hypothetical protein
MDETAIVLLLGYRSCAQSDVIRAAKVYNIGTQ